MANTANLSTLTTDFNVNPYYDDYDQSRQYYRMLYKPGYAVQARELTQSQTMLQKQVDRFAKHIFKEGSMVINTPGASPDPTLMWPIQLEKDWHYIKVKDRDVSNNTIDIASFKGQFLTGNTSGIRAYVGEVLDGVESSANTKTLYVRYLSANATTGNSTYQASETLSANIGTVVTIDTNPVGMASRVIIQGPGVFFAKEHFIYYDTQTAILGRYSINPSAKVGFYVTESIVDYNSDVSLLDPALESSNYSAPGADRLKLNPVLTVYDYNADIDANFVELYTIKDGITETIYNKPQYSVIREEFARRTYDESGDYYVDGLEITIRENLKTGNNLGYLESANGGNNMLLSIGIGPGSAYVKGYPIGMAAGQGSVTTWLTTEKGLTYSNVASQIATASWGSYVLVDELVGTIVEDQGTTISLYNTPMNRISNNVFSGAQSGSLIGTAKLKALEYDTGTMGTSAGRYKLYLYDIQMTGTSTFTAVRSVYLNNSTIADFGADIVLENGNAILKDTSGKMLIYTGSKYTRTLTSATGLGSVDWTFKRSKDVSIVAGGTFSLPIGGSGETFPYGTVSSLDSTDKRDIIVTLNTSLNIALPGTASSGGATKVLGGSVAAKFTRLNVGDKIEFSGNAYTYTIESIASDTSLTTVQTLPVTLSGNAIYKAYKTGDIIDMTGKGVDAGADRTISTTPTSLSFDLKETLGPSGTFSASISYVGRRADSGSVPKNLRVGRYAKINVAAYGTTSGPFYLGYPDVYKIRSIRKDSSPITSATQGSDVTSYFTLNNGQKDDFYDHASIKPKGIGLTTSDHLLVELDYFYPDYSTNFGYFSIDSYPINDTTTSNTTIQTSQVSIFVSPTDGIGYDLRNLIDFRPVKDIVADATTIAGASINPTTAKDFVYDSNGLRTARPSSDVTYDYSFYFARRDIVVVDKDSNYYVVKGNPAVTPISPTCPSNAMELSNIYITPYPSLSPAYGQILGRLDLTCVSKRNLNRRFTMRDIGVLKNRIDNLETYTALNLLEKKASDLLIPNDQQQNRFKNGIFTDTFADHSLGDTSNPEYIISIDDEEKCIRPLYDVDSVGFQYLSGSNVQLTGDLVTLAYTEVATITQPNATTNRNMETSVYRFVGSLTLDPELDFWVDTQQMEPEKVSQTLNPYSKTDWSNKYNSPEKKVTGYKVFAVENQQKGKLLAEFATSGAAYDFARRIGQLGTPFAAGMDAANRVFVDEISDFTRSGIQNIRTESTTTTTLGDRVVHAELIPYIRPQTIRLTASGLKANTRFYVFFDGENMTDFVLRNLLFDSPSATPRQVTAIPNGRIAQGKFAVATGDFGDPLYSDSNGNLYCELRLPSGTEGPRFKVGTKDITLTDSLTNEPTATSSATAKFVAQGLLQQKQKTILSTRTIGMVSRPIEETTQTAVTTDSRYVNSCMAYSFIPTAPVNEEGMFLTSVDLYLQGKSRTLGFWCEIREMDSAGGITETMVPFSDVYFEAEQVVVSDDAQTPMKVTFRAPVFVYSGKQYAFIVHPQGSNPDMYFWVAELGEPLIGITPQKKYTNRAKTGTLFTTNNNRTWDIVPNFDLKITFYRASFVNNVNGVAVLGNQPIQLMNLNNMSKAFSLYGEPITTYDKLTITANTGPINVTDLVIGSQSGVNAAVTNVTSGVIKVKGTGFINGENVSVYFANAFSKSVTAKVSAIAERGSGTLRLYSDRTSNAEIHIFNSNGKFAVTDSIIGTLSNTTSDISSIRDLVYSTILYEPSTIQFNNTGVNWEFSSDSGTTYIPVTEGEKYDFSTEQSILSRSGELITYSGSTSTKARATLSSASDYISPVIDIGRTHCVYTRNIINSNTYGENHTAGGALVNKYISRITTLAEGQDAEDVKVILTSYRPPGTDVKVYFKISHNEDGEPFFSKPWTELTTDTTPTKVYSSFADKNDYIEYTYTFPTTPLDRLTLTLSNTANAITPGDYITGRTSGITKNVTGTDGIIYVMDGSGFTVGEAANVYYANAYYKGNTVISAIGNTAYLNESTGIVEYHTDTGQVFSGYKQFAVKIGLISNDGAVAPKVADLRVIALQV